MKNMLTMNGKLGVKTFNIKRLCPGATDWCLEFCYAGHGPFMFPSSIEARRWRYEATLNTPAFVEVMSAEISRLRNKQVRIHSAGDFYSVEYIEAWIEVCKRNPDTSFGAYTRVFSIPEFLPALKRLAALPNVALWWSVDPTTPVKPPPGRVSYIDGTEGAPAVNCGKQLSDDENCVTCQRCWNKRNRKTTFKVH